LWDNYTWLPAIPPLGEIDHATRRGTRRTAIALARPRSPLSRKALPSLQTEVGSPWRAFAFRSIRVLAPREGGTPR